MSIVQLSVVFAFKERCDGRAFRVEQTPALAVVPLNAGVY
jgi:hypothetical protein